MLHRMKYRRAVALLMSLSLLSTPTRELVAAEVVADEVASNQEKSDSVIELFSNEGRKTQRIEGYHLAERSVSMITALRAGIASRPTAASSIESMRQSVKRLRQLPIKGLPNFELTTLVLDALTASSDADFRANIARIPVNIVREEIGRDDSGTFSTRTTYSLQGVVKIRVTQHGLTESSTNDRPVPLTPGGDVGLESRSTHGPFVSGTENPLAVSVMSDRGPKTCELDPDECPATQQEKDDYYTLAVALLADTEATQAALTADEVSCYEAHTCFYETNLSTSLSAVGASELTAHDELVSGVAPSAVFLTPDVAIGAAVGLPNCAWKYFAAAGASIALIGSGAALIAATLSPEPVSKFAIIGLWGLAVGSAAAFVAAAGEALVCHVQAT